MLVGEDLSGVEERPADARDGNAAGRGDGSLAVEPVSLEDELRLATSASYVVERSRKLGARADMEVGLDLEQNTVVGRDTVEL